MVVLLPRLPGPVAETLLEQVLSKGLSAWSGFNPHDLPEAVRFAATGGSRVSPNRLAELHDSMQQIARTHGFGIKGVRNSHDKFDADMAALLADNPLFASGEALRDDVWAFVGVSLAPDIVHWRFGATRERYLGGVRNTFQRLWMRGRVLDRGAAHPMRWQLLEELTEDALVQITERPSLGGDPVLARAIAETWVRASHYHDRNKMEPIMRRASLRARMWNEVRSLPDLPTEQLHNLLSRAFAIPEGHQEEASGIESHVSALDDVVDLAAEHETRKDELSSPSHAPSANTDVPTPPRHRIRPGDKVQIRYLPDAWSKEASLLIALSDKINDPVNGVVCTDRPLGQALVGREEGDLVRIQTSRGARLVEIECVYAT